MSEEQTSYIELKSYCDLSAVLAIVLSITNFCKLKACRDARDIDIEQRKLKQMSFEKMDCGLCMRGRVC